MLNYTAGSQVLLSACKTADIKTVYCSRKFVENADLEEQIQELEKEVTVIYLEDLANNISLIKKISGLVRSYYPHLHYRRTLKTTTPDDACTILFTSGSEGMPKGVVLSHINILSNYAQSKCFIDFGPGMLCLIVYLSFIASD